jgi:multiple antibiotic resistance protein
MPVLIGPGTISVSVILGNRHDPLAACIVIAATVAVSITMMLALKAGHDFLRPRNARLVQRYMEVAGRITALYVGTVSIDMIMQGICAWADKL